MVISYSVFTYLKSVDLYPVSLVYTQTAGIIFARYKMTAGIHLKFDRKLKVHTHENTNLLNASKLTGGNKK